VANRVVYVGSNDRNIYALDATNGAKLWSYTTGGPIASSPAVANRVVYVGSNDRNIYALDATNGAKLWSYTTGGRVESAPTVVNGVVYVGSYDFNTYALNATNGAKLWSYTTGGSVWSSPAVINGVVYVGFGYAYAIGNADVETLENVLQFIGLGFVGLAFIGFTIRFRRWVRRSVASESLSGLIPVVLRKNVLTIGLLTWLTAYVILRLLNGSDISGFILYTFGLPPPTPTFVLPFYFEWLASMWYLLAIVGIITHYCPGKIAARTRLGPLCGFVGVTVEITTFVVLKYYNLSLIIDYVSKTLYLGDFFWLVWLFAYLFLLSAVGVPLWLEYLKEDESPSTESFTRVVRSEQLSDALTRRIENLEILVDQVRRRMRRDLTILTSAVPIIFICTFVSMMINAPTMLVVEGIYVITSIIFLYAATRFSHLLKKPKFAVLAINGPTAGLERVAAAEQHALMKEAHPRFAIFLLYWAIPPLFWLNSSLVGPFSGSYVIATICLVALLLSSLACFLLGYWVLTRTSVIPIVRDEPSLHGLLEDSVGIMPAKVLAGEAQSVLMDFNVTAAPSGDVISSEGGTPRTEANALRPHYEVELQAATATVDGEKQCPIFDAPTTCKKIWNCSFEAAGTQVFHLLFNEVRPARAHIKEAAFVRYPLFTYMHYVRVDGVFSTNNLIAMIGVIVTGASVLVSLIAATHQQLM
ncbi:MAG: outer membrane protein assembly factor BamB family protein, partial [Halobacteriota archaeon]